MTIWGQKTQKSQIFGACGTGPGRPGPAPQTYFNEKHYFSSIFK